MSVTKFKIKLDKDFKNYLINFVDTYKNDNVWTCPTHNTRHFIDTSGLESHVPDNKHPHKNRGRRSITLGDIAKIVDNEQVFDLREELLDKLFQTHDDLDRNKFRLTEKYTTTWDSSMLSVVYETTDKPSHGVEKHYDNDAKDGWITVRINFLVQKAKEGGEILIDKTLQKNKVEENDTPFDSWRKARLKQEDVEEDEGYMMMPSKWAHGCNPVSGKTIRILLSILMRVEPDYFNNYLEPNYG